MAVGEVADAEGYLDMECCGTMTKEEIRAKLKKLLVEELFLEDITPEEIADDEVLFGERLGLDSLDAVEIVVLLQRNWDIEVRDMEEGRKIFYSIETLAQFVHENTG